MRKVAIVVNSRANYARIKSVLKSVNAHPKLELQLVVGASALLERFGNVAEIIQQDGFRIDWKIYSVVEGENLTTMAKTTGNAIQELATAWENLTPDMVLTVADRYETLATAVSASYMNIPVAHTQGGERTGSIDESVRHAVTKLAHLHLTTNEATAAYLINELGEDAGRVYVTGCPSLDILTDLSPITELPDLGVGPPIDPSEPFLAVLQHPVTTEYESAQRQIEQTLAAVSEVDVQTVWLGPNVDAGSDAISKRLRQFHETEESKIHFYRNFTPEYYGRLINQCACLVGNSSSAIREGSFLGVPAVNIGSRQRNRHHEDNVMSVDCDRAQIRQAIHYQMQHGKYFPSNMYGDGKAGEKIANILARYIPRLQK